MAPLKALACFAATAVLFHCALAATITVGGSNDGWDQTTDLRTWAASQTFTAGDTLVFQYTANHDVVEVTKANYDACQASSPIGTYTGGNTAITLSASGKRYFICGTPGHCAGGMKLEVHVVNAASSAPPPASSAPPPASSATPPPTSAPPRRAPERSPSPSSSPKPAATSPGAPENSPPPSSSTPGPAASAEPSGAPAASTPSSPPSGPTPQTAPSAAGAIKASAAAGFVCGLLMLLAF